MDGKRLIHDQTVNREGGFGSTPRGGQALILGVKVNALLDGRANVAYEKIDRVHQRCSLTGQP